eukprot:TRINITY_DN4696_c0_g1_i6.p1 TRINITY_DN4696_c0_g1~~TRINITY_DN4696_c0_g1_i6.p1  ORF type:complete len:124 (+),score=37.19 TRINITY_DN4696_c0_g1_i6:108-479(+)
MFSKALGFAGKTWSSFTASVKEVIDEQRKVLDEHQAEEKKKEATHLPWEGLRLLNSNRNGNITDCVKDEILALSKREETFLVDTDEFLYEFPFQMEDYVHQASKVIEFDERLSNVRNRLVPSK